MTAIAKDFKAFLLRGNVVELAVAIVIGTAFGTLVTTFVTAIITPVIAAMFGEPFFQAMTFSIGESEIAYGVFLDALAAFVMVAAAVYFLVVAPVNALTARRQAARARMDREADAATRSCPECLSEIPLAARRCAFCTAQVAPAMQPLG